MGLFASYGQKAEVKIAVEKCLYSLLKENELYPVFIEPNNPQQNGKMERFWQKLEYCTAGPNDIDGFIYHYNMTRVSMALRAGNKYKFLLMYFLMKICIRKDNTNENRLLMEKKSNFFMIKRIKHFIMN